VLSTWSFGYDPAGNLTSKQLNANPQTTFTYNAANELTGASGGMSATYTYNGNGDRTSATVAGQIQQINLNVAGQITSITPSGQSAIPYAYTGTGEQQRVGAGSTTYQYDGAGLSRQTDSNGDTTFTALPDGTLLSENIPSGTYAGSYYYLTDGAGSVAAVTDSTGAVKDSYSYDPLGNATASGSVPNPFTFQGGMYDSQTGYYYTGSGYYDPATEQSFGCHDNGRYDPGEDNCGEDEPLRLQPITVGTHAAEGMTFTLTAYPNGRGSLYFRLVVSIHGHVTHGLYFSLVVSVNGKPYDFSGTGRAQLGVSNDRYPYIIVTGSQNVGAHAAIKWDLRIEKYPGFATPYLTAVGQFCYSDSPCPRGYQVP